MARFTTHAKERLKERYEDYEAYEIADIGNLFNQLYTVVHYSKDGSEVREIKYKNTTMQGIIKDERIVTIIPCIFSTSQDIEEKDKKMINLSNELYVVDDVLTMEKLMTTSEIAEALNVHYTTINKIAKKLYPSRIRNGVRAYFNEVEATLIKNEIGKGRTDLSNIAKVEGIKTSVEEDQIISNAMQILLNRLNEAKKENESLKPKAALAEVALRDESKQYSITDAGKHLGLRQSEIFDIMRNKGYLTSKNMPSQKAINKGILSIKTNVVNGHNRPQAVMTMENINNFREDIE